MFIDFLTQVFRENREQDAIIWRDMAYSYRTILEGMDGWRCYLDTNHVSAGSVVSIDADFSPNSVALILAMIERGCIIVPLTNSVAAKKDDFLEIAQVEFCLGLDEQDNVHLTRTQCRPSHELLRHLAGSGHPGLILFSSGSTGKSKAAVHDLLGILNKFKVKRRAKRAITFLLYDHIGGFNTMLYQLSNGVCIVTVPDRNPDTVLSAIEKHQVETLPTSPTFMNLVLLSEAYKRHDLSSLTLVTYGTEPMPESTLRRVHEILPDVQLLQTYGLSEVGILRSKSRSSDSLWVKVGGEGFETRVVEGVLQIKAESAMLGYLNAPSPFTEDGWFNTGDRVEVDGEYIKILGRQSEIINVGGQKVYPAEVESIVQEMENIAEVVVFGEKNAILGQIVCAHVRLKQPTDSRELARQLRRFCRQRLQEYQVPAKVTVVDTALHGERFKKTRCSDTTTH